MKTMKNFLFISFLLMSLNSNSGNLDLPLREDPFSEEISKMLLRSSLIVEEDLTVKVVFTLSEDKLIQIESISSSNETVNAFLRTRLSGQKLQGADWKVHQIYELPVRVKAIR
jgi:hypothetical protein